jgi:probable metal-binding protein
MNTTQPIHGHEVIQLLHAANPPLTRNALHAEVTRRWGESARFYTCSAEDLTLDDLLAFLAQRGKLVEQRGLLIMDMSQVCNHAHDPQA